MTQRHAFIIAQSRLIAGTPSVLFSILRKPSLQGLFFVHYPARAEENDRWPIRYIASTSFPLTI